MGRKTDPLLTYKTTQAGSLIDCSLNRPNNWGGRGISVVDCGRAVLGLTRQAWNGAAEYQGMVRQPGELCRVYVWRIDMAG